jgi:3-hydroxyisobutyrate dehydrogenase-like beta-hydroxyacid dehydrogenase
MKVGFIGLGEMGKPMAKNLLKHGFPLATCAHIKKQAVEELKRLGAEVMDHPSDVAATSDVVITMVRDIPQTDEVIYGRGAWEGKGALQGIRKGSTIIICSTLLPGYCQRVAADCRSLQVSVLDAPVSGGTPIAESGGLTFLVGGDTETFTRCRPVLEAMGKNIFHLGGSGAGQAMKLINNYMMLVNAFGTSEAISAGLRAGLDLRRMLEIIGKSSGNSTVIQNWDMLAASRKSYQKAGGKSIFRKDLELAIAFFEELGHKSELGSMALKMDESQLFPTENGE